MYGLRKKIILISLSSALITPSLVYAQTSSTPPPVADAEYRANWGLGMINALPAYLKGYTGKGIIVAVIDSGLDANHPEYAGRVSPLLFNFGDDQATHNVFPGIDQSDGSLAGHGDHVAGIIAAGRNGSGMQGVAYDAILMPLRAIEVTGRDADWTPDNQALIYAADHGAKVINGSYGPNAFPNLLLEDGTLNPHYQVLSYQPIAESPEELWQTYHAMKHAADSDVVMVFAAGNERQDQPGAYTAMPTGNGMLPLITPDVIRSGNIRLLDTEDDAFDPENPNTYSFLSPTDPALQNMDFSDLAGSLIVVVAVDKHGNLAPYSNECGATAEWCMAAPGGDMTSNDKDGIYSTWPQGDSINGNRPYQHLQGTSMASPHVAGAAAVVRSAFPYMTARQTIETLLTTTTKNGYTDHDKFGQGLLNLGAAVDGPMEFRYTGVFDVDTQGVSSIWSNAISGIGNLTKRGDGVLVLTGQSTYQGPTNIVGGSLEVNGSITSATHVSQAGQLAGTGSVGDLTLVQGGKVSPGSTLDATHALGTLTVNGSFNQQAGSTYVAGLSMGVGADKIAVNGAAQIDNDASLELMRQGVGSGGATTRYTLLSASNGVVGSYGDLSGDLVAQTPFINFALNYDANHVFLDTSRSAVAFADIAATANQRSTATALQSQGEGAVLHDHLLFLNGKEARQAYDQLSGEAYAAIQSSLLNNSAYIRTAAYKQLSPSFASTDLPAIRSLDQPALWAHGFGDWTTLSGNHNVAESKTRVSGFLMGVDMPAFDAWRLGLLAGYSHTNFRLNDRQSSAKSDDYTIGAYAGTAANYTQGVLAFRSGLSYTWHNIDMKRSVAFAGFEDTLSADYKANTFQIFGELGYAHRATEFLAIEPYANLAYVHLNTNAFREKDRHGAALSLGKNTMDTGLSSLGLRITAELNQDTLPLTARADVAWRHAFGDITPDSEARFAGSHHFSVNGTSIGRNTLLVSSGLDFQLKQNTVFSIAYQGQFGSSIKQNGLNANVNIRF